MRRLIVLVLLVAIVAGGLYLAGVIGGPAAVASVLLSVVRGEMEAQRAGAAAYEPAFDGDTVRNGDLLRTDTNGRGYMTFFEGSVFQIEPGANVAVSEVSPRGEGPLVLRVEQTLGRTWASVQKFTSPNSRFEVKTPALSVLVRGTAFETIVAADGTTTVRCFEGELAVTAQGVAQILTAGTQIVVAPGAAPGPPQPMPALAVLRVSSPAGTEVTVIDDRGLRCGGAARELPRCTQSSAVVSDVAAGEYAVVLAGPGGPATITVEGLFGGQVVSTRTSQPAQLRAGGLARTRFRLDLDAQRRPVIGAITLWEDLASACSAEVRGRLFASGSITERMDALAAFAVQNKGQAAGIVFTGTELTTAGREAAASVPADVPVRVSELSASIDVDGVRLSGQASLGPLSVSGRARVVASALAGRLKLRMPEIDLGPLFALFRDQVRQYAETELGDADTGLPLAVERIIFRKDCVAIVGRTR